MCAKFLSRKKSAVALKEYLFLIILIANVKPLNQENVKFFQKISLDLRIPTNSKLIVVIRTCC